jgi:lipopolysaccharide transport system ATP-binding protein
MSTPLSLDQVGNSQLGEHLVDELVISVRKISKKFCRNLRRGMVYGIKDLSCNLAGIRQDTSRLRKHEFWALRDLSFDIRRGESVGVIGLNGSGKTTLFRLLHGIFPPDVGEIAVRGRIGTLTVLGAGFDPYFTGRENIYLNATILGIPIHEIERRIPDIVEFSELDESIDAPICTYSAGMRVRLGFAVAVHIDPQTLLIDEVLAVGDVAFKDKCYRYITEFHRANRTVLFVSHNMKQISMLCDRALLLEKGGLVADGPVEEVVAEYLGRTGKPTAFEQA